MPITHWSASTLAEHMATTGGVVSEGSVRRILTAARLQPHRQKMWLHSHDEEFREKRDDVLRVYYETPADQHIICLDEKPGMQALERRYSDVPMAAGEPVKREWEYIRHGTIALMGAFDVRTGRAFGYFNERTGGDAFVDLLQIVADCYPTGSGHLVCDNHSAHDTDEVRAWLEENPRWSLHFTPKHASWLNQVELFFSILQRRVMARGSFTSKEDLVAKVTAYLHWHNDRAKQFRWTYRPRSWDALDAA